MTKTLLDGIEIDTMFHTFNQWLGEPIKDTYGGKAVLDFNGKSLFAELVALEIFRKNGYDGVWVDTYKKKFRVGLPENCSPIELPININQKLQEIINVNKSAKGVWDLLLWQGGNLRFVELKRKHKDAIRETQINFLKSALHVGLTKDQFEILEWDIKK